MNTYTQQQQKEERKKALNSNNNNNKINNLFFSTPPQKFTAISVCLASFLTSCTYIALYAVTGNLDYLYVFFFGFVFFVYSVGFFFFFVFFFPSHIINTPLTVLGVFLNHKNKILPCERLYCLPRCSNSRIQASVSSESVGH